MTRGSFRADDNGPDEELFDPSKLVDGLLALLDEAGVPKEINDKIVRFVETWEFSREPETLGDGAPDY